jgi:DNA-binding transcriptional regulator YiaG
LSRPLLKQLFIKNYPASPKTLGERIRKARMDAGLQIKELAGMLGVTEDTVINWEIRGMKPLRREVRDKVARFMEDGLRDRG